MWELFDPDDMLNALTQPERDLFGTGASDPDFPDRLAQILSHVVSRVRGKVAANLGNSDAMGPEETIPEELYGAAVQIARFDFLTAFPQGKLFIDEARVRGYQDALKQLDDVSVGKLLVTPFGSTTFTANLSRFGSRDDYLNSGKQNLNVTDFGFFH